MAKSSEATLYGVKNPNTHNKTGEFAALHWAKLRAPNAWGHMTDDEGDLIVWFNDPGARDDFNEHFSGVKVTLHRRNEQTHVGNKALDLLKRAKQGA